MTMPPALIDVHHHARPLGYIEALRKVGVTAVGGSPIPQWERGQTLELMDRQGIGTAMLSSPDSESAFRHLELGIGMSRQINEMYAQLIADAPTRFGGFASLPLPHIDQSLAELEYALDTLCLDGVLLSTNHAGIYPGDPRLDPILEELNRRGTVAFVHPATPVGSQALGLDLPAYVVEFVADTTRCIGNLIVRDVPRRFPRIRFIFSHAGGAAPYFPFRLAFYGVRRKPEAPPSFAESQREVAAALSGFYYDVAMSADPATIVNLTRIAGTDKVLFGSDHPQMTEEIIAATVSAVTKSAGEHAHVRGIPRDNALVLFPRLAGR